MGKVIKDLVEYNGISALTDDNLKNFKQMNVDYTFCIPDVKPNIDQLIKVWIDSCIVESKLVKTPIGTSLEGQIVTGYKLLIAGDLFLKIEYSACNSTGSVHTAHTTIPFCGYIVLPSDINPYYIVKPGIVIEDIFSDTIDCRCVYNNITFALVAEIC